MAAVRSGSGDMYSLKWNHHQSFLVSGLSQLHDETDNSLTDVTLACEGQFIEAHKIILSLCSPFFKQLFRVNRTGNAGNMVVVMSNVKFKELKSIIQFIYHGQANVSNADLNNFLQAADILQIEGLAGGVQDHVNNTPSTFSNCSDPTDVSISQNTVASRSGPVHPSSSSGLQPPKRSRLSVTSSSTPTPPSSSSSANVVGSQSLPARITSITSHPASSHSHVVLANSATQSQIQCSSNENECDPLGLDDEVEEEMICLDNMKSEPIAIFSLNEEQTAESVLDSCNSRQMNIINENNGSGLVFEFEPSIQHTRDLSVAGPSSSTLCPRVGASLPSKPTKAPETYYRSSHPTLPRVLAGGVYYQVSSIDSNTGNVIATCQTCHRHVKGRLHPSSNFTTHLKKHKDIYEKYKS